jgi:hypothetical protein
MQHETNAMAQFHMKTNGKLIQDGVTSLSYRNLNKILRAALCSDRDDSLVQVLYAICRGCFLGKIGHNFKTKTAHFKPKNVHFN